MSLTRFAVRICAARVLRGATLAEDRVFQSAIDPLNTRVTETTAPMLLVNTDDHKHEPEGKDLTGGEERMDLVIEATIASKVESEGVDGEGTTVAVSIPSADEGMDLTLDILEHQAIRALVRSRTVWGDLLSRFVLRYMARQSRRGADTSGVRFAARQIVLTCDVVADPVGGESLMPGGLWHDFLAALEADHSLRPVGLLLRAVIEGDGENPDWQRTAAMIGVRDDVAKMIGVGTPVLDEDGEPVLLEEIEFIDGDRE